jgi:hypothetical protein
VPNVDSLAAARYRFSRILSRPPNGVEFANAARDGGFRLMTEPSVRPPNLPPGARVVDAELFRLLLGFEIEKARRLRYCLSVVCLKNGTIVAAEAGGDSLARIVASRIRATDVATERGRDVVLLLLIDADPTTLPIVLRRIITDFEALSWSAGVAAYPKSGNDPDDLIEQASAMASEGRANGGRELSPPP